MKRTLLALLLALAWPYALAAQRDTTVCTAFRTRTAVTGAIVSTSVAKVGCSGVARVDTVKLAGLRDTVYFDPQINAARDSISYSGPFAWRVGVRPAAFKLPLGPAIIRVDTVRLVRVDTVKVPVPAAPPAPAPTPTPSGTVELPRIFLDTRMPVQPMSGDTLYQVNGVWWCRGPTCAATRASHDLPEQGTVPPPAQLPWVLVGRP